MVEMEPAAGDNISVQSHPQDIHSNRSSAKEKQAKTEDNSPEKQGTPIAEEPRGTPTAAVDDQGTPSAQSRQSAASNKSAASKKSGAASVKSTTSVGKQGVQNSSQSAKSERGSVRESDRGVSSGLITQMGNDGNNNRVLPLDGLPALPGDNEANNRVSPRSNRSSKSVKSNARSRDSSPRDAHHPHSKDKIRTDVFLTDYTVPRMNSNLLANSLQARLRKTIPFDLRDNKGAVHKIKRDSMKDMIQLAVLDRQFQAEMQRQKCFMRSQENQLKRRQQVLRRRTELHKVSNERIQAQIRARTEPVIVLPKLTHTGVDSVDVDHEADDNDVTNYELTAFSPILHEKPEELTNLEYSIRMVRMCQAPGAFLNEVNEIRNRKKTKRKPEDLDMMTDDTSSISSGARKSRSNRSVAYFSTKESVAGTVSVDGRRQSFSAPPLLGLPAVAPPGGRRTLPNGSFMPSSQLAPKGIVWQMPSTEQSTHQNTLRTRNMSDFRKVSKDLHPVSTLMNKLGIAEKQTAAHVPGVGEQPPSVVLPSDVSKYHTPLEMANHVAKFLKKYPLKRQTSLESDGSGKPDDQQDSCHRSSADKTEDYSVGSGMSTNRSVGSEHAD